MGCAEEGFLCESHDYLRQTKNLTTGDLKTLQEAKDRFDIVLANPPFGGKERKGRASGGRRSRYDIYQARTSGIPPRYGSASR
jgi:type I restriction-modification system DNA methylase subunit